MKNEGIVITAVLNGWTVRVGCQTVVFGELHVLLEELAKFLREPSKVAEHYLKTSVNKHVVSDIAMPAPPPENCGAMVGEPMERIRR